MAVKQTELDVLIKQGHASYFDFFKIGAIKHDIKKGMSDNGLIERQIIDIKGNTWNYVHLDGNYKLQTN